MLTKRAHHYHRILFNHMGAYTTDTIYRGEMIGGFRRRKRDLVATFQNSLTLLSSEVEGRTYGGGVLELVPTEVGRLIVPLFQSEQLLAKLDRTSRKAGGQRDSSHAVMQQVDDFVRQVSPAYAELLPRLRSARERLKSRRQAN